MFAIMLAGSGDVPGVEVSDALKQFILDDIQKLEVKLSNEIKVLGLTLEHHRAGNLHFEVYEARYAGLKAVYQYLFESTQREASERIDPTTWADATTGNTLLHYAVDNECWAFASYLCALGAKPQANKEGTFPSVRTVQMHELDPLYRAQSSAGAEEPDDAEVAQQPPCPLSYLQASGMDLNQSMDDQGNTWLHQAIKGEYYHVVRRLLGLGVDPNRPNNDARRVLDLWLDKIGPDQEQAKLLVDCIRRYPFDLNYLSKPYAASCAVACSPVDRILHNKDLIVPRSLGVQKLLFSAFLEKGADIHLKHADDAKHPLAFSPHSPDDCEAAMGFLETFQAYQGAISPSIAHFFQWNAARPQESRLREDLSVRIVGYLSPSDLGRGGALFASDLTHLFKEINICFTRSDGSSSIKQRFLQWALRQRRSAVFLSDGAIEPLSQFDQLFCRAMDHFGYIQTDGLAAPVDDCLLDLASSREPLDQPLLHQARQTLLLAAVKRNDRAAFDRLEHLLHQYDQPIDEEIKCQALAHIAKQQEGENEQDYIARVRWFFLPLFTRRDRSLPAPQFECDGPTMLHQWLSGEVAHPILFRMVCHSRPQSECEALFRSENRFGQTPLHQLCLLACRAQGDAAKLARLAGIRDIFLEHGADFSYAGTKCLPAYNYFCDESLPQEVYADWSNAVGKPSEGCVIS